MGLWSPLAFLSACGLCVSEPFRLVRSLLGHLPLQTQGTPPATLLTLTFFAYMFINSKNIIFELNMVAHTFNYIT